MGRPKIRCDYTLFGQCPRRATVLFIVKNKKDGRLVASQYCQQHTEIMLAQPIPPGWRIAERMELDARPH